MKTAQHGAISGALITLIAVVVLLGSIAAVSFGSYVSAKNYGARTEASLKASQTDSRNVLAQLGQKIREVAQVPKMYADDVERVTTAAIEGRYGADGSKATFQWLQEQNPQLDPFLYSEIQQTIKGARKDFEVAQRRQTDIRRQYEGELGTFWRGFWLGVAGYPKVDLKEFDIVSTAEADEAFRTKQEAGPIQLR